MKQIFAKPVYKHAARFSMAFFAMILLFIFLAANIKWTGYEQAVTNVFSILGQGHLVFWTILIVLSGLLVYIFRNK